MMPIRHLPHLVLSLVFTGILASAGGLQLGIDLARGAKPQVLDLFTHLPTITHLRAYEKDLENHNWLGAQMRTGMQVLQFFCLNNPGEKALLGYDGWLFYKPGVHYLTHRTPTSPEFGDTLAAICQFRDQLAARGIQLLVLPAPNKESIYPEQLSRRAGGLRQAVSQRTRSLLEGLNAAGVEVVDLFALFAEAKSANGNPLYLARDTHWSPAGLELAAWAVAERLRERGWIEPGPVPYDQRTVRVSRIGDLMRMLQVPQIEAELDAETVECRQVLNPSSGDIYEDDRDAKILILGDSFLRIFQADAPGAAGFIAHLARILQQPLTSIINDGGASTLVRQELHRRPELLHHKKVVVWEFVERDIQSGLEGWQNVPLPPAESGT